MEFHPDKCKVVTIKHRPFPLGMLPFVAYHYHLGENLVSLAVAQSCILTTNVRIEFFMLSSHSSSSTKQGRVL